MDPGPPARRDDPQWHPVVLAPKDSPDLTAVRPGARRDLVLLGSTGSIGTQAADIVRRNPGRFRLTALAAGGGNPGLLASQALEFGVEVVAAASERAAPALNDALQARARESGKALPKVLAGSAAVAEVAAWPADVVLN